MRLYKPESQVHFGEFFSFTFLRSTSQALEQQESQLLSVLIPPDVADAGSAVLEIRAGTGGREAALFAGDLLRMYQQYVECSKQCRCQLKTLMYISRRIVVHLQICTAAEMANASSRYELD